MRVGDLSEFTNTPGQSLCSLRVEREIPREVVDVQRVRGGPAGMLVPDDLQRFHLRVEADHC